MKKNSNSFSESGNAMIYILVVVALFAALTFVLSRNTDTAEQSLLSEQETEVLAGQIIQVSNQVKQGVDTALWGGTNIANLDFCVPVDACYAVAPFTNKVFHPEGGGMIMPRIQDKAINQVNNDPAPGWYMGRFNNVEWTEGAGTDVILIAHQIKQNVCEKINDVLTGDPTPRPLVGVGIPDVLISKTDADGDNQHSGTNEEFNIVDCPTCDDLPSACVVNAGGTIWSFYNIIAQR